MRVLQLSSPNSKYPLLNNISKHEIAIEIKILFEVVSSTSFFEIFHLISESFLFPSQLLPIIQNNDRYQNELVLQ